MKLLNTIFICVVSIFAIYPQIIIDHRTVDITKLPETAIISTKQKLHIAYGHTSHGSQLITGMTGLIDFANKGGKGLKLTKDIFKWNRGGTSGALDLHDGAMANDCGYYPDWVNETKNYLNNTANSKTNVIMWSWCGQVDDKYKAGKLFTEYIDPMVQLEKDYPDVTFVYMTGHVDHWDDINNKAANKAIRDFCITNKKVLFDFADIESYDPDGKYLQFPNDNCDYYESVNGKLLGNWAKEWQNKKTVSVDWYNCSSAHSEPLNANLKAYAAWHLFARIAGWDGTATGIHETNFAVSTFNLAQNYPNPFNPSTKISFNLPIADNVTLKVYDVLGREAAVLINNQRMQKGTHEKEFNAKQLTSGIYFYRIESTGLTQTRKMILCK